METILIVDDEKNYLTILSALLEEEGYEVLSAPGGQAAFEIHKNSDLDLILTDMKMPGMDGIELLENIKADDPDLPVIMMTAHGTVDKAVEAMQKGAYTYILKPFDNERLIIYVKKAITTYQVVKENRRLRDAVESQFRFDNIIGKSKKMRDIFDTIQKVAPSNATVLIEGESGTGKELVARSIHFNSARREKPFVAVNCGEAGGTCFCSSLDTGPRCEEKSETVGPGDGFEAGLDLGQPRGEGLEHGGAGRANANEQLPAARQQIGADLRF